MFRAGLVFFIVLTLIAATIGTIVYEATRPPPPEIQLIKFGPWVMWFAFATVSAIVALPATVLMMLGVWRRLAPPFLLGLIAVILAASALGLLNYLDTALSANELKRSGTARAFNEYLIGLAVIVPAYLLTFGVLFRVPFMAPLMAPGTTKSTALP